VRNHTRFRCSKLIFRGSARDTAIGGATRYRISLEGVVQGVGFRPFVKKLADRFQLPGIAFNTAGGLIVEVETERPSEARRFIAALGTEAPAAAKIDRFTAEELVQSVGYDEFRIAPSHARKPGITLIPPDLATCHACLEEIRDPAARRFRYPFTNCTNCGPRYTIALTMPYDRINTTMRQFPFCVNCAAEYADPADRRFHAEPVACGACGPQLSAAMPQVTAALERGEILAIKGLGGFQLACDALRGETVDALRLRKRRSRKPFAVMMRDMEAVERYCAPTPHEREALQSAAAPIVLLKMRENGALPDGVAPRLAYLGVMLPYTPMHHLLFGDSLTCLVMTSGNISEEPIVTQNDEALEKLSPVADRVVTHNRDIFMRVDDSVVRVFEGVPRVMRRARGYAPGAIRLRQHMGEVLAVGPELKNTFCLISGGYAIMSQHLGDMENVETLTFFEETLRNLQSVYRINPTLIAHDLHPDYLTTRWAMKRAEPKLAVQHHHAHIASCMAENSVEEPVIGVAFDGTGLGTDGQIWGGEFLVCDYRRFERWAHLRYAALPGGDRAARQGWRVAASYLHDALGPEYRRLDLPCWQATSTSNWALIDRLIAKPAIRTSSCGRLFDAVSAVCGISFESGYEGESAMLLEAAAHRRSDLTYEFDLNLEAAPWTIETRPVLAQIARDISSGRSAGAVSRAFHDSVARMIQFVCRKLREKTGLDKVCLSGGTFQNVTLLEASAGLLRAGGFQVFLHSQVPPNDGGLSLGQAVIAAAHADAIRKGAH
jgi:hydrogenase maturation protein HypF